MSKYTPEHRIDSENRMDLDWHAARALRRIVKGSDGMLEFEGFSGEERRDAIMNPATSFREGDAMREALLKAFDRIESVRTPEQQKLLDFLLSQCEQAALVWAEKFPLKFKGVPSKAELMAGAEKWLQSLSADVLQGFVELCPDSAQFVIVPGGIAAPKLLKAIDGNKTTPGQTDSKIWAPELWNKVKADRWGFGITDAREDLPFDPSIYYFNPDAPKGERKARTNEQMVAEYEQRFAEKKVGIMPQHGYVPTAANRLAGGNVLDRKFWTVFKRPRGAELLPSAVWDDDHVGLYVVNPDSSYVNLRCRPWAEGEMEI